MFDYQRSLSTSRAAGATLKYEFTGTGLDILGQNNGTAKLEVTVDGKVVNASATTTAASQLYQTFSLRGLSRRRAHRSAQSAEWHTRRRQRRHRSLAGTTRA